MSIIPKGQNLFIVNLDYLVPFDQVEPHLDAHMDWIQDCVSDGTLLVAGAKVPRTGGVIVATSPSLEELEGKLNQDPFVIHNVAKITVTEFRPNTRIDALK